MLTNNTVLILSNNTKTVLLEVDIMELPTKPTAKVQYNLRIEPELMEWLKNLGQECERSVNYLINHAVKQMKNK